MSFDPTDIYDAAALYDMWLNCHGCTQTFDFEPDTAISLGYYHEIGQRARKDGWLIAEQPSGQVDGELYLVLCPHCVAKHRLEVPTEQHQVAPEQVLAICQALQGFVAADEAAA